MKLAVFGSRKVASVKPVLDYLEPRFDPEVTLMSGGAMGVDTAAESYWQGCGGKIISLRVLRTNEGEFAVQRWEPSEALVWVPEALLTFADWKSAAYYRSWLMADEANIGVAFWNGRSSGTSLTLDRFRAQGKSCPVHSLT